MPEYRDDAPHLWVSRPLDQHGGFPADDDCEAICTVCHSRVTVGPDGDEFGHGYGCPHRADHLPTHQSRGNYLSDHVCPTCGRGDFDSQRALRCHHAGAHGEAIPDERTCEECGDQFEPWRPGADQQYCSTGCARDARRDRIDLECATCGDTLEATPWEVENGKQYCSKDCKHQAQCVEVTLTCEYCGDEYTAKPWNADDSTYCSSACLGRANAAKYLNGGSGGVAGD